MPKMKTQQAIQANFSTLEDIQNVTPELLKSFVLEQLQWSEEQLFFFIHDTGLAYLKEYFGKDEQAIKLLSSKPAFWTWFNNHWQYRDQAFVEAFMIDGDEFDADFKADAYNNLHNPKILVCELYPSKTVLGKDFSTISILAPCLK